MQDSRAVSARALHTSALQMSSQMGTPSFTPRKSIGRGHGPRREHALLVEHAIIREIVLIAHSLDPAAIEQRDRVIDERRVAPGQPDQNRGSTICGVAGKALGRLARRLLQCWLQHHVLKRVAGKIKLGEDDKVCTGRCHAGAHLAGLLCVARKIAHDGVQLRECELEAVLDLMRHERKLSDGRRESSSP